MKKNGTSGGKNNDYSYFKTFVATFSLKIFLSKQEKKKLFNDVAKRKDCRFKDRRFI